MFLVQGFRTESQCDNNNNKYIQTEQYDHYSLERKLQQRKVAKKNKVFSTERLNYNEPG